MLSCTCGERASTSRKPRRTWRRRRHSEAFNLGAAGRSAIDVWKVTLPAPPKPFGQGGGGGGGGGGDVQGDSTTGGGWLARSDGKINFGFNVKQAGSGFAGELHLNDKAGGAKIHVREITALGAVTMGCGFGPDSPQSLRFEGMGTYNGHEETFEVCVQDNAEPGKGADRFYLSCSCGYQTRGPMLDDMIDGGNIQVRRSTAVSSGGSAASTLILDPVLLTTATVGQTQVLSVRAFDGNQNPLSNAAVTLTRTTAGGGADVMTAVSGPLGVATFPVVIGLQPAEYIASVGSVQSNAVAITP